MRMASRSLSEARVPKIDLTSISNMEKVLVNALTAAGFTNAAPSSAHRGKDDSGVEVSAVFTDEFEKAIQIKLKPGKAGKYHIIPTMDEIDFDLTGKFFECADRIPDKSDRFGISRCRHISGR